MRVRMINKPDITGWSDEFNIHGLGEIIVTYDDGSASSEELNDYEICREDGTWISFREALMNHEIVTDDRFHRFRFALTDEERKKGYYLT